MRKATIALLLICGAVFAQQKGTLIDSRDGKKYKTVEMGTQIWMAQNLDYRGEDGYLGLCYGDEPKRKIRKPENCKKYGRLYDWTEAMKACPENWHLPDDEEWEILVDLAGGREVAGKKLKAKTESKCKWTEEKIDNRGRVSVIEYDKCNKDEYGFSALLGSGYWDGRSFSLDNDGWWSASDDGFYSANRWYMAGSNGVGSFRYNKGHMFSVRCVQKNDKLSEPELGSFTDSRSGKIYKTVKIGKQTWMAENLNYNATGSKCGEGGELNENGKGSLKDENTVNCDKYGRLYKWETALNVCPAGWHLPSKAEWNELTGFIGGKKVADKKLKSNSGWNENGNGTDEYGFSAQPGGYGNSDGSFDVGISGNWWSADEKEKDSYYYSRYMSYGNRVNVDERYGYRSSMYSVRCVQDHISIQNTNSVTFGIYPQSSERLLTDSDLQSLSKKDLRIMRNEIFARHGYIFQSDDLKEYFKNQSWYTPKYNDVNSMLTNIETKNVQLIKRYE